MHTAAALYIDPAGPYAARSDLDLWPLARNADLYAGPLPVIAHPPCGHWGKYRHRCRQPGRDCLHAALAHVRRWRGVLEHPLHATTWTAANLPHNCRQLDLHSGWTLDIDQHRFGHPAVKPTRLYIVGTTNTPPLPAARTTPPRPFENLSARTRAWTPPDLIAWLVELVKLTKA